MEYIVRIKLESSDIDPVKPWDKSYNVYYGSGVFVSPVEFLTNFHVVDGLVVAEIFHTHSQKHLTFSKITKYSQILDLALIEVKEKQNTFIEVGNTPEIGDFLTGYGFGGGDNINPRKTEGIVSRIFYVAIGINQSQINVLETTMNSIPGDSGSPAINEKGKLVGIRHAGNQKLSTYAFIPSFMIHLFLRSKVEKVDQILGYAGIEISSHNNAIKASTYDFIKIGDIVETFDNKPIIQGSIHYSYIIEEIEGKPSLTTSYTPIFSHLLCKEPGTEITLSLIRDEKRINIPIILEKIIDYFPVSETKKIGDSYISTYSYQINNYLLMNNLLDEFDNYYASYILFKRMLPIIMHSESLTKEFIFCPILEPHNISDIKENSNIVIFYRGINIDIQL